MESNVLDILVPVYGKEPSFVYDNLREIINNTNNNIGFVIVYKNSDEFNYDLLNQIANDRVVVRQGKSHWNKTDKLLLALRESKAKYILPMDSHHGIIFNQMEEVINILINKEKDIFTMNPVDFNVDKSESKVFERDWLNAGRYILNRKSLCDSVNDIDYRITYCDDLTFPLFLLGNKQSDLKLCKLSQNIYLKRFGSDLSKTTVYKNEFINNSIIDSLLQILNSTKKFFGNDNEFDRQFITTFWYLVLRYGFGPSEEFIKNEKVKAKAREMWDIILGDKFDIGDTLSRVRPYPNWIDEDLEIYKSFIKKCED